MALAHGLTISRIFTTPGLRSNHPESKTKPLRASMQKPPEAR